MRTKFLGMGIGVVALAAIVAAMRSVPDAAASATDPVVVELFSSEGCSSCPPADVVLAGLDGARGLAAPVIALELHVDYWNSLGWPDPFSSAEASTRQRAYAEAWRERGVYTPELVVDGATGFNGADRASAVRAIEAASKSPKAKIEIAERGSVFSVGVTHLPASPDDDALDVWIALTESALVTDVPRGENAGRKLAHGPVVRLFRRIGAAKEGAHIDAKIDPASAWRRENLRFVAFVQAAHSRRIVGAASIALQAR